MLFFNLVVYTQCIILLLIFFLVQKKFCSMPIDQNGSISSYSRKRALGFCQGARTVYSTNFLKVIWAWNLKSTVFLLGLFVILIFLRLACSLRVFRSRSSTSPVMVWFILEKLNSALFVREIVVCVWKSKWILFCVNGRKCYSPRSVAW